MLVELVPEVETSEPADPVVTARQLELLCRLSLIPVTVVFDQSHLDGIEIRIDSADVRTMRCDRAQAQVIADVPADVERGARLVYDGAVSLEV